MFFARGDELACDTASSLSVVDFESILSIAFVVPAHLPGATQSHKNASESLRANMESNYYVALPPRLQWKHIRRVGGTYFRPPLTCIVLTLSDTLFLIICL
jgi:hypothetical protein